MALSAKTIRTQLAALQPLMKNLSLETTRRGQDMIGELMELKYRRQVTESEHSFESFSGAWVIPKDERRQGVILYLHGGGYTCGGLDYAKGFGSTLAVLTGAKVFCAAYRLAPEHPFPAALDDAVEAYRYLLHKGYSAEHIALCGESAGGGLCYALCLRIKELGLPMPCCVIAVSPWTDLTASGPSYEENRDSDPSLTRELLDFYAGCYTEDRAAPLVSPLFARLEGLPPSLIYAGGDEILLSDARFMHEKLIAAGCRSRLIVKPERWHGYLLYGLEEDSRDMTAICRFLDHVMAREQKLRWMRLDNAAKIYPAARRRSWSNVYRLSATLTEPVDAAVLQSALDVTVRRFPSIAARLRRGVFWFYLQQLDAAPTVREESSYPLTRMSSDEMRQCALRVIVYKNRIAVELFHSLTDGTGAMIFLKSLVAEYLQQRYGIHIPNTDGVLDRLDAPSEEELEDSFLKYAGPMKVGRTERGAWHLSGTPETAGFLNLTCFSLPVEEALNMARRYKVSLTAFLSAAVMHALQNMQKEQVPDVSRRKPIKVQIPVNLRRLFKSSTLRNFAFYTTPELLPRLGEYSFDEICRVVQSNMMAQITPKQMSMKIAANVASERSFIIRIMPLFLKNIVMKAIFDVVGERSSCLCVSNLGAIALPEGMERYVERMDFILGSQATSPYNCGVLSYGGTLYINFTRNIREPGLESHFFRVLRDMGLRLQVESNLPD